MNDSLNEFQEKIKEPNATKYFNGLLVLFLLFFVGNILSIYGGMKAVTLIYDVSLSAQNIEQFIIKPTHPDVMIFIQNLYLILAFGLPAMVFLQYFAKAEMYQYMGIKKISPRFTTISLLMLGAIMMVPIIDLLADLNLLIPNLATSEERKKSITALIEIFLSGNSYGALAINLFNVALLPAICEELFFRASLQNLIKDWIKKPYISILITAFIFSMIHGDLSGFIPRMFAGIILGFIYLMTENISLAILFHFIYNSFTVIVKWMMNNQIMKVDENMSWPIYIVVPATCVLAAILYYIYKLNHKRNAII